jgi:tetratricopeptide (TPR) repeat protein
LAYYLMIIMQKNSAPTPRHKFALLAVAIAGCLAASLAFSATNAAAQGANPVPAPQQTPIPAKRISPNLRGGEEQANFLYQYLLSEIAVQRGDEPAALATLSKLAKTKQDARLARRAMEVAFKQRDTEAALDNALLWLELDRSSPLARQAVMVLTGSRPNVPATLETSTEGFAKLLAEPRRAPLLLMQMSGLMERFNDKVAVSKAVQTLAAPYENLPEAQFAIAQAHLLANELPEALTRIARARGMKKDWSEQARAVMLNARILLENKREDAAISILTDYLKTTASGDSTRGGERVEVQMMLGRVQVGAKAYLSAREAFRSAMRDAPNNAEPAYAAALISLEMEDFADAETMLQKVLAVEPSIADKSPAYFNLAAAQEGKKEIANAIASYQLVGKGNYFLPAQARIAKFLSKTSGLAAGEAHLQKLLDGAIENPEDRTGIVLAMAQLLRDEKQLDRSFTWLSNAISDAPETVELLYDRSMLAEKLNKFDVAEADLRKVIRLQPDHAQAHNALGYMLTEHTTRYAEARELIDIALKLSPEDSFIIDSLGWLQFKTGQFSQAVETLRRAYKKRPDGEIAAHLGEALWLNKQPEEARKIWAIAVKDHPQNEALQAVIVKYAKLAN